MADRKTRTGTPAIEVVVPVSPAHEDPALWGPRLVRILKKQLEFYRQLAALSVRQHELIEGEKTDALMALLTDRQRVIEQISDVNSEVEPFAAHWAALMPRLDAAQRTAVGGLLEELDGLVETITDRDEKDRHVLESRRASASEALDDVSRRRAAVGAYGGQSSNGAAGRPTPRYQDRKG